MKIINTFPYFNEKELLELRIKLLYDYVDKFLIIDADHTHKGDKKPFTCKDTIRDLDLLNHKKIEVIEINLRSFDEEPDAWFRERSQRNIAEKYIEDDDIIIVSDCDEIINPKYIKYYCDTAQSNPNNILRIPMIHLNGRADLRVFELNGEPVSWNAAFICMKNHINEYTLSEIRESYTIEKLKIKYSDIFITNNHKVEEAGWHFSWMGNYERMKIKSNSYLHANDNWFGQQLILSKDYVAMENGKDPLGREQYILKKIDYNILPQKIFEIPTIKNYLLPTI